MYLVLYVRDFWKIVLLTYFVACLQKPANPSWELLDVAVVPRSHSTILTTVWDSSWYLAFVIFSFFERSEFLIATSQKKSLRVCPCAVCSTYLGFSGDNTNLGFSVGYVLCTRCVCTWYHVRSIACINLPMGPERGRSTIDGGYELEAGISGLYCLERAP